MERRLEERTGAEQQKRLETLEQAQKDIDAFYTEYNKIRARNIRLNNEYEKEIMKLVETPTLTNSSRIGWKQIYENMYLFTNVQNIKENSRIKDLVKTLSGI
jgi:hypothetical protein